ncbi:MULTISPECIES: hypothetical protein [unclassified Mesorhizobium]|uniref:hypothetical protein n=1 Tax=unclassified Mesorhizobium TaxID=325217 RepID=UPI000FCB23E8|nr:MULTISPECIES: hypothetical protein [unclassified Mesorhizobium]RVD49424.1 hypothetical protein EN746_21085 [Mesorhizobium sp. M8A.F.Ca.ET.023.02.2.1]TGR58534.1 hypothetical protein EN842_02815 [bacterium M00.F.Ca.ET.199.01.1.1]TGU41354.1 hypothetical protein EN799_02000 [bacterium M00.F.Ca.ET.156.01.1.1]TGV90398.1 hypothetical protein EN792_000990 [Mesorhizobium sp. M00.F.Ca.ET.149.01.1.1]RUW46215.1 hypothetical protein EOA36_26110 [Mesorhizobium sp. M8A.F.Ca.ET.021.01.1.1]
MSTIELQTLTGPEVDGWPARGRRGKIAKWLSGSFAAGPHLSIRQSMRAGWSLGQCPSRPPDAARPPDPVAFAMDFLRGPDDSLPTSNEA